MDSFIFIGDYIKQIQTENLNQIIGDNVSILDSVQRAAIEECTSYLKQKYNITRAFEPVAAFDPTNSYKANQTVYLNATQYDSNVTYALNALTQQAGSVYICTTAVVAPEEFDAAKWQLLGELYSLFYTVLPQLQFDYLTIYAIGDKVFWKDNVYTALKQTPLIGHAEQLEINSTLDSNIVNIFPDDPKLGLQYWGTPVAYSVAALTSLLDTTKWLPGDARDQKLLMICIDIALYHLHSRITPRNIPEVREIRYMGHKEDRETRGHRVLYPTYSALGWLQAASIGDDITPELDRIQPRQGNRIRFGGNAKLVNQY